MNASETDTQEDELIQGNGWVVTYLDTFTLLLAFFIILTGLGDYKFFTVDQVDSDAGIWTNRELMAIHAELNRSYESEIRSGAVRVDLEDFEIKLSFVGNSFFDSGEARLLPGGSLLINRSLRIFQEIGPERFSIDVEGHTDSRPIQGLYPSNWELSAARAAAVVRDFIGSGYPLSRIKASGYADSAPVVNEFDAAGRPDPDRMALNRRIVFRIYVKSPEDAGPAR